MARIARMHTRSHSLGLHCETQDVTESPRLLSILAGPERRRRRLRHCCTPSSAMARHVDVRRRLGRMRSAAAMSEVEIKRWQLSICPLLIRITDDDLMLHAIRLKFPYETGLKSFRECLRKAATRAPWTSFGYQQGPRKGGRDAVRHRNRTMSRGPETCNIIICLYLMPDAYSLCHRAVHLAPPVGLVSRRSLRSDLSERPRCRGFP